MSFRGDKRGTQSTARAWGLGLSPLCPTLGETLAGRARQGPRAPAPDSVSCAGDGDTDEPQGRPGCLRASASYSLLPGEGDAPAPARPRSAQAIEILNTGVWEDALGCELGSVRTWTSTA